MKTCFLILFKRTHTLVLPSDFPMFNQLMEVIEFGSVTESFEDLRSTGLFS